MSDATSRQRHGVSQRAFLIALLLIAANLRPSLTGVGPLLETLRADLRLSATAAGWLGSSPLLMFAAFAPLARLARQLGAERLLLAGLVVLIAGIVVRSAGGVVPLFAGTVALAAGIASINVLIPALVKQHSSLILALSFMGLRAANQQMAAALSLMSQSIGYLVAACGPILFGLIHDYTGTWTAPLLVTAGVTVIQALCGVGAGRGTCR